MPKNVQYKVSGTSLVITVDLTQDCGPSASGKTIIVATTGGNIDLPGGAKLGLNVYKPNTSGKF